MPPSTSSPVGLAQQSLDDVAFDLHSIETLSEIRISGIAALPTVTRPSTDVPATSVHRSALKAKPRNMATYELPPKIGPPIHSKREPKRVERGINRDRHPPVPAAVVASPLLLSRGPSPAPSIANSRLSTPAPPLQSPRVTSHEPQTPTPAATTPMSIPPSSPAAPAPAFEPATPNPNNSTAMQSPPESRKRQRGDNSDNANDNGADSDGAKDDDTNGDGADNNGANDSNANNNRGQRRSKRIRTSSSTSRPSNTAATSKAFDPAPAVSQITSDDDDDASPEWFRKAVLMLSSKDLGGGWLDLVAIWSQFEKAAGYTEAGILSSEGRPTMCWCMDCPCAIS